MAQSVPLGLLLSPGSVLSLLNVAVERVSPFREPFGLLLFHGPVQPLRVHVLLSPTREMLGCAIDLVRLVILSRSLGHQDGATTLTGYLVGVRTGMLNGAIHAGPRERVSLHGFFPAECLGRGVVTGIVPIRIRPGMQCLAGAQVPHAESARHSGLQFPRHIRFEFAVRVLREIQSDQDASPSVRVQAARALISTGLEVQREADRVVTANELDLGELDQLIANQREQLAETKQ